MEILIDVRKVFLMFYSSRTAFLVPVKTLIMPVFLLANEPKITILFGIFFVF